MRCHSCASDNPDENNFCGNCGARLVQPAPPTFTQAVNVAHFSSNAGTLSSFGYGQVEPVAAPPRTSAIEPQPQLQIERRPKRLEAAEEGETEPASQVHTISGPSFLGLATATEQDESDYLLQDDAPRRGGWLLFSLAAVLALTAIGWVAWRHLQRSVPAAPQASTPSQQSQPAQAQPPATGTSAETGEKMALPQSDNPGGRFTTVDPSVNAESAWGESNPEGPKPKHDAGNTREAQSRQAKDAAKRRAEQKAKPTEESNPHPKPISEKIDPQQNRMLVLGENYLEGHGVPRNCEQAVVYFRAAAEENNAPAMSQLAGLYNSGECVKQDRAQAYSWLKRAHAIDPGNEWIERDMDMLWREMSAQQRASLAQ